MKVAKRRRITKNPLIRACLVAGAVVLCAPVASRAINAVAPNAAAASQQRTVGQNAAPPKYSAGVADIVKLVDAKVDTGVIETYIRNSPTAYNPSATEIIALKNHGVGPEILTAMLQRGGELRAQAMAAVPAGGAPSVVQAAPVAVNSYAPAYDYSALAAYPDYTYAYPAASYAYPSYSYGYPGYCYGGYNCGYYWPWYWPSFYSGCYPYGRYCGYGYCAYGRGYPYHWYGSRGRGYYYGGRGNYGGHGYYGGRGYYGGHAYSGGRGHYSVGARPGPSIGRSAGFRSFGGAGRPATFARASGGFGGGRGFSGHAVSFGGRGGGFGGGHGGGRGR